MMSFMELDGVTFLRMKDITITCKHMRRSLSIGGSSSVQWWKFGRSWRLRMCFRRLFLCVRIEIDQLQWVNCCVIIHYLLVSCMKINHLRCALVIWSSLQLTSNNSLLELIYFLNKKNPALLTCRRRWVRGTEGNGWRGSRRTKDPRWFLLRLRKICLPAAHLYRLRAARWSSLVTTFLRLWLYQAGQSTSPWR